MKRRAHPAARSSAAARSSGSGEIDVDRLPAHRMREGEARGVQELALEPEAPGRAVVGVAGDRVADRLEVGADLVGAAGLERHPQQRGSRGQRALEREVGDGLARAVGVGRHEGADAAVAAERRVDRAGARGRQPVDEREVLAAHRAGGERGRAARGAPPPCLATTSRPEVSRSSRWTIPARPGSSPPAARPASACGERAAAWPRAGCTTTPGRLVDHEQVLVLVGDRERRVGRGADGAGAPRPPRRHGSPAAEHVALGHAPRRRPGRARPRSPRWARAREPSGAARNASSRSPAASARDVELSRSRGPRGPSST